LQAILEDGACNAPLCVARSRKMITVAPTRDTPKPTRVSGGTAAPAIRGQDAVILLCVTIGVT
jgi:hypothetical protein